MLYRLQEIDLEIDARCEALERVESRLGRREALTEAEEALSQQRARLGALERVQREAEWQAEGLRTKIAQLEAKLYGGSVRNPRELQGLHEDVIHLKARLRSKEDEILDMMSQVEEAQDGLSRKAQEVGRMAQEWEEDQEQLLKEQAAVKAELASLAERRASSAVPIDRASLDLYEALRAARQGRAVAKVEQGMCQGCRIILPMTELQRVRLDQELVQCSSCGRILYLS